MFVKCAKFIIGPNVVHITVPLFCLLIPQEQSLIKKSFRPHVKLKSTLFKKEHVTNTSTGTRLTQGASQLSDYVTFAKKLLFQNQKVQEWHT